MKIAILGFNVEGRASYDYFVAQGGHEITICDRSTDLDLPAGAQSVLGDNYLDDLDRFDLLIRSPGLYPQVILNQNPNVAGKITTQTNIFLEHCPSKNIIGVTGTKGKGTTSSLITAILKASGKTVHLGGNIGVPVFDLLKAGISADDYVVLELSNFQLIDVKHSTHIAVCLMMASEHLDWHPNVEDYFAAKTRLFAHQKSDDIAIYFGPNEISTEIVSASPGTKIPYFEKPGALVEDRNIVIDGQHICRTDELKLLGQHNWQNACAAVTASWQVTQDVEAIRNALTSFAGLEHRLEFVRELDGVSYYNDSYGTTPETAIVAIQAFDQPKILILGGHDKGANYDELARSVKNGNVRKVVLIGEQADRIGQSLTVAGYTSVIDGGKTMQEIVANSQAQTHPGDVVILSTATASFDMFESYKDRGDQFNQAVLELF